MNHYKIRIHTTNCNDLLIEMVMDEYSKDEFVEIYKDLDGDTDLIRIEDDTKDAEYWISRAHIIAVEVCSQDPTAT